VNRVPRLTEGWAADEERRELAGVPDEITFETKPQMAGRLLQQHAHDQGIRAGFVAGDDRTLALELAPHMIRVNSLHPTQVNTDMIMNEPTFRLFMPDIERPTVDDFGPASQAFNALPIPWVEPVDISNALLFLASDEARYITGVCLPVDAGAAIK
jgi:NAD(P)-dependent dehydrogenase (short-subunit alcohol dehydrogenase family)